MDKLLPLQPPDQQDTDYDLDAKLEEIEASAADEEWKAEDE